LSGYLVEGERDYKVSRISHLAHCDAAAVAERIVAVRPAVAHAADAGADWRHLCVRSKIGVSERSWISHRITSRTSAAAQARLLLLVHQGHPRLAEPQLPPDAEHMSEPILAA
jgi:hypothetical protein